MTTIKTDISLSALRDDMGRNKSSKIYIYLRQRIETLALREMTWGENKSFKMHIYLYVRL